MQWYYSKNGSQLGPISTEDIKAKLASSEIAATDLVWKEGMADWVPAGQVGELRSSVATPAAAPSLETPTASPAPVTPVTPYSPPAAAPGQAIQPSAGGEIPNYLWQSIVVTILCCWPLGIPAIVFAAKVDGLKARGDIAGALAASKNAKTWTWVCFGSGLVVIALYVILVVVGGIAGAANQ
ncbi:CD225/dispanin family protein [Luteolibacter ambystomatis]|uniref:CD225/dispanin family protein n=1 Tax=Luteolibacter ambystomatis TaxID=2824561 RepID=A0A975G8Q6_9BACT|nr:CD225/dispanin family protein [Luteolibacter ambystomatis]QUE51424.1 CD225/dispanin family protein [Luteolibacter ambystomatis]